MTKLLTSVLLGAFFVASFAFAQSPLRVSPNEIIQQKAAMGRRILATKPGPRKVQDRVVVGCSVPTTCQGLADIMSMLDSDLGSVDYAIRHCTVESACLAPGDAGMTALWITECKTKNACFEKLKKAHYAKNCPFGFGAQANSYTCSK
ncbi:hypothetical protein WDW86_15845 [Bdellovibrionota bacterium FG-2]